MVICVRAPEWRCPAGSFYAISNSPYWLVILTLCSYCVAFAILAVTIAGLVSRFVLKIPPPTTVGQDPLQLAYSNLFQRRALLALVVVAAVSLAFTLAIVLDQSCLSDKGIYVEQAPWAGLKSYPWSSVRHVDIVNDQDKSNRCQVSLELLLADSVRIETFKTSEPDFPRKEDLRIAGILSKLGQIDVRTRALGNCDAPQTNPFATPH